MAVVHPLTPTEVVEILDGLHARLEARPGLALDPSFMGLVRLAVTASPARGAAVAPAPVAPAAGALLQAQGHLTDALALCADQANEIAALKGELAALRTARTTADDAGREALADLHAATAANAALRRDVEDLGAMHARVVAELEEARAAYAAYKAQADPALQVSDKLTQQRRKARSAGVELVRRLKILEHSRPGSGIPHPKGSREILACPACGFVDPEAARGVRGIRNAGHSPDCALAAAIEQASSLVTSLG